MTVDIDSALGRAVIPAEDDRPPLASRFLQRTRVLFVLLFTVALWAFVTRAFEIRRFILPSPDLVIERFFDSPEYILGEFWFTVVEAAVGFGVAATLGILLAIVLSRSALLEELVFPYLNIVRVMPSVAIAPLLVVWFGHTPIPHIIVATTIAFFPIVVTMMLGLRSADPELINLMRTLNASEAMIFRKIRLPNSLPYLFAAFRISAPLAVIGVLVGQFAGGTGGMGQVLIVSRSNLDTPMSFLMVALSCVLGIAFYGIVVLLERRFIRWHPSVQLD